MKRLLLIIIVTSIFLIVNNSIIHAQGYLQPWQSPHFFGQYGQSWEVQPFIPEYFGSYNPIPQPWSSPQRFSYESFPGFSIPQSWSSRPRFSAEPSSYYIPYSQPLYGLGYDYPPRGSASSYSLFNPPSFSSPYPSPYTYRYPGVGMPNPFYNPYTAQQAPRDEFNRNKRSEKVKSLIQSYGKGEIPFINVFVPLTSYLEDYRNNAEILLASTPSVERIIFMEMPEVQGLIDLGEEVIDPIINKITDENLENKRNAISAYAYVLEILDAKEAIPALIELAEKWKSIDDDPFSPLYFLTRTLDVLSSEEGTETSYKDYFEPEFVESVINKARDYLEHE